MNIPTDYIPGYAKGRALDPELAEIYVRNTMVADPLADAAIESLAELGQAKSELITACMNEDKEGMRNAPKELKEFFEYISNPPSHIVLDHETAMVATRAFFKHSDLILLATILDSLVTGLSEGLSKVFYVTGRTAKNVRRLRQNGRHILEIKMPDGLNRFGDGWKLTVRIRLIHAQVRRLMLESDQWDVPAEGYPIHASHLALGNTGFSAVTLDSARRLGVPISDETGAAFMHIWHYAGWLIGIPDELVAQFKSEKQALHLRKIAQTCELPPGKKAIAVAHGYINATPEISGITDPEQKKKFTMALYRASRALLGDELADTLEFPKQSTFGVLPLIRTQQKLKRLSARVIPGAKPFAFTNFTEMLDKAVYDDAGISYRMPDAVRESAVTPW